MPNVSQLIMSSAKPMTETEKTILLGVVGVPATAATLIKDATGKVIQVVVNLPATAAANAKVNIDANPGIAVSTAIIDDLIPGTTGASGDLITYDALTALPGTLLVEPGGAPVKTDNGDGTMTFAPNASTGSLNTELRVFNTLLPYPNVSTTELKFKFGANTGDLGINFFAQNIAYNLGVTMYNNGTAHIVWNGGFIGSAFTGITDLNYHIVKLLQENGAVAIELDGVEVFRQTVSPQAFANLALFGILGGGVGESLTLDYWRWTENV